MNVESQSGKGGLPLSWVTLVFVALLLVIAMLLVLVIVMVVWTRRL